MHVEQHDVGPLGADDRDRGVDVGGLADELAHRDPARGHGVGQLGAHAGAEHPVVVDEHDPHGAGLRASAGRGRLAHGCSSFDRWQPQLHLGAVVAAAHARRAAVPLHPSQDRLAHAEPVGGHGVEVEPVAAVAHERLDPGRPDLDVGRDRRAAVPHRVEQGLAHGLGQRGAVRLVGPVAGDDEVDRHAVEVLDVVRDLGDRGGERRLRALRPGVQPRPQLALLGAGQPGDGGGVAGLALDEGEGLQHRVVQVGGDVGALGGAGGGHLLAPQVAPQPQRPRARR